MTLSGLTGLSICVALVAFSFTGCFVLQDAFDTVLISQLARVDFSSGCRSNGRILCCCFRGNAISLIKLHLLALGAALVTSFRDQTPFHLSGFSGRFCSFLGSTKSLNKSCLGVFRSAAAVGVFVVSNILQISIPIDGLS